MRSKLLLLAGLAFLAALFAFRLKRLRPQPAAHISTRIIGCSPDWSLLKNWIEETDIPPIPGAGSYAWKISTENDSAQFYFNQGISMYYSFHIIEAMASFKKAARFDPDCAMLYWAQALAYGPNINDVGYAASPDALAACKKALDLSGNCTEKERLLIQAQDARYSDDSTESRQKLNQLYADKMKTVYEKYPADADAAALYADAMMLQHPWDLWNLDGSPRAWTPVIREVLEKLLRKTPDHPGANHYYIHVMEPSPFAYLALPSADRLGKLTPGLSHTVHMPSHIYLRTGKYDQGVFVNEKAINSYKKVIPLYAPVTGNDFLYIIHNLHMQTNNAMLGGRETSSIQSALETKKNIPADYLSAPGAMGNYIQYIYMSYALVDARFGRWEKLLSYDKPDDAQVYSNIIYHFGRGMAFAGISHLADAKKELGQIRQLMKDSSLQLPIPPFSPASDGALIAENLLAGTISLKEKNYTEAISAYSKAAITEANMVYNEPRDWMLSPKHYLGNAYLVAGKWKEAENCFLQDLQINNENGWALYGLYQSMMGQGKKIEAGKVLARFKKAFAKADITIKAPVLY